MKWLFKRYDGGDNSGVTGYWLLEWKKLFSIVVLKFEPNHRENYHSHAFAALTWWLRGRAVEEFPDGTTRMWAPSLLPKYTPKHNTHRYKPDSVIWAFSIRGPWEDTWKEYNPQTKEYITLSKGRKIVTGEIGGN